MNILSTGCGKSFMSIIYPSQAQFISAAHVANRDPTSTDRKITIDYL